MQPAYANTLTVVLVVVGAIGCVGRFDYNLVLALGWLYLGQLNLGLTNSIGFYVMVFGSILVDVISIVLSINRGGTFTILFIALIEILLKVGIVTVCAYDYFQTREQRQQQARQQKQRSMQNH